MPCAVANVSWRQRPLHITDLDQKELLREDVEVQVLAARCAVWLHWGQGWLHLWEVRCSQGAEAPGEGAVRSGGRMNKVISRVFA